MINSQRLTYFQIKFLFGGYYSSAAIAGIFISWFNFHNQEVKLKFYISEYATTPVWNLDALVIAGMYI